MTELEALLLDCIRREGPLTFAAFQEAALYHPELGYYAGGGQRSGWQGHFLTSAEIDPAFGALWAVGFRRTWETLGSPAEFEIVEIGPGEGGFARSVLEAVGGDFADALTYRLVERIPSLAERQMSLLSAFGHAVWSSSIESAASMPHGCVIANEVVDNLPVHLLEVTGGGDLVELYVDAAGNRLAFERGPLSGPSLSRLLTEEGVELFEGQRVEVGLAAVDFLRSATYVIGAGAVFLVDYGVTWRELKERPSGTLASFSKLGADDLVLERPGTKDVTSHANWDVASSTLEAAGCGVAGPTRQRDVLHRLGLGDLQNSLATRHTEFTADGRGADAVRVLSRGQALGALTDPSGLGGLQVLCGAKGIPPPDFMTPY